MITNQPKDAVEWMKENAPTSECFVWHGNITVPESAMNLLVEQRNQFEREADEFRLRSGCAMTQVNIDRHDFAEERAILQSDNERLRAQAVVLKAAKAGWYCWHCNCIVPPEHVTFEETHDPLFGGCGGSVE